MPAPKRPALDGLRKRLEDSRAGGVRADGFVRETFLLPREDARAKAREWLRRYPKAAYWTEVESWRVAEGDAIEFTMRRLRTAE
ncbi:MAG: hypothetical protein IPL47_09670 [Phyllobacteriaceae bacterium]|nr:hypothetical protein [Phyllobacteriaceae bacterium]